MVSEYSVEVFQAPETGAPVESVRADTPGACHFCPGHQHMLASPTGSRDSAYIQEAGGCSA